MSHTFKDSPAQKAEHTNRAARAQRKLVEDLPHHFFEIATHDEPLAIAAHAHCDLMRDGDWGAALKLNRAIATRLELLEIALKKV